MKKFMNLASAVFIALFLFFVFFGTLIVADQSVQSPVQAITLSQSMMTTSSPEVLAKVPTFNTDSASALFTNPQNPGWLVATNTLSIENVYKSMAIIRYDKSEVDGSPVCLIRSDSLCNFETDEKGGGDSLTYSKSTDVLTGKTLAAHYSDPTDKISGHNLRA